MGEAPVDDDVAAADKGGAERTKRRILAAARSLFAEREISSVSIRDIAESAGVSHGLVQRYFGTRDEMIEAIIRQEVEAYMAAPWIPAGPAATPEELRESHERLTSGLAHFHDFAALIVRAELGGIEPERMLGRVASTPAGRLAEAIEQAQAGLSSTERMDPRLVSAYVNAAVFAFSTMSPWLMTSVGLAPDDYERRLDEIVSISARLIRMATGAPPAAGPGS